MGLNNITVQNLTLTSDMSSGPSNVFAASMTGITNGHLSNLRIEDARFGLKLGGGSLSTGWLVEDIVTRHTVAPLYIQDVHDSTFRRLDLEGAGLDGRWPYDHPIYINANVQDSLFEDLTLTRPSGYAFHIDANNGTSPTARLVFRHVLADASWSGSPMVIMGSLTTDIQIYDLTAIGANRYDQTIMMLSVPTNILIDGFNARGSNYLVRQFGGTSANGITFRNGNFNGVRLDYGNPATRNLNIEISVTLNGPETTTPPPASTAPLSVETGAELRTPPNAVLNAGPTRRTPDRIIQTRSDLLEQMGWPGIHALPLPPARLVMKRSATFWHEKFGSPAGRATNMLHS